MDVEPCSCERAGWCSRHQLTKEQPVFELCKGDEMVRARWDEMARMKYGPGILRKAFNFSLAMIKQTVAGNPTCEQDEIDRRAQICYPCELFNGRYCTHGKCGCPMDRVRFLAKLSFETAECPLDKW